MKAEHHELVASEVLRTYARAAAWEPQLPIPVEQIIERTYGLTIEWETLDEEPEQVILGALHPLRKTIYMNEKHANTILSSVGPTNFTFGHELGHWLYDAGNPDQGELFDDALSPVLCRGEDGLTGQARLREVNANKFAACLLMPRDLVLSHLPDDLSDSVIRACAREWQVSVRALEIRLEQLGLWGAPPPGRRLVG